MALVAVHGDVSRRGWETVLGLGIVLVGIVAILPIVAGFDAVAYLAAGQRLNDGHQLYALSAGDLPVALNPPYWDVPLLSPPLIAVVWRFLAPLGMVGLAAWSAAVAVAVAVSAWYVARSWLGVALVAALIVAIAFAATTGNVSGLLLPGYLLIWIFRDRPWVGSLIGVMGVLKLLPFVFVGFLIARRDRRGLAWFAAGTIAALAISVLGAGIGAHVDYLGVMARAEPQPDSLAYLTGLRWLSPVILVGGTLLACVLPERWAFYVCILTIVLGAPTLAWRETAAFIALLAPFIASTSVAPPRGTSTPASSAIAG